MLTPERCLQAYNTYGALAAPLTLPCSALRAQAGADPDLTFADRFVDNDDVEGFLHAMGFTDFLGRPGDLLSTFGAALDVTEPARIPDEAGAYDKEVTRATHQLLRHWQEVVQRNA